MIRRLRHLQHLRDLGDRLALWTAPGLDDTSWLLLVMFVSASLFFDYRSERPTVAVRLLTAFRRGLSGIGWSHEGVLGSDRAVGDEIDADRRDAARCQRV